MKREKNQAATSRRRFLQRSSAIAIGTPLLAGLPANVHAGEDNSIRLALIGCGGRGSGAVRDALTAPGGGPVKLYAMADLLDERIERSLGALQRSFSEGQIDVSQERKFVGFDAYRHAIDLLRPGDVAMCTTRCYIRPIHVEYAVAKGVNVFMEKPFAPDPGGLQRMLRAGEQAEKNGVKISAGLQCRHSPARQALIEKMRAGALGEIPLIRANRLGGASWLPPQDPSKQDIVKQLQIGKSQLFWVGSGHMVDNLIHQIDECCWIKDAWPVKAEGMGGRAPDSRDAGQNLDVYSMEYTFADGSKAMCGFRRMKNARNEFATFIHGERKAAQFSGKVHAATVHMFRDQRIAEGNIAWTPEKDAYKPWIYEWKEFLESIRTDRPHNEARRAVYSDLASLMGRAACHTGQTVTWDDITNSRFQFCENLDAIDFDSPVPAVPDDEGRFTVPVAGKWREV